jgi:hypothetical protein
MYPGKYFCSCGDLHYDDETCPRADQADFYWAVKRFGFAWARGEIDKMEEAHKKEQAEREAKRKQERIEWIKAEIERNTAKDVALTQELESLLRES